MSGGSEDFWAGRRVLVTGATGFLGRHLEQGLTRRGATCYAVGSKEADLRVWDQARELMGDLHTDVVIHAAVQGGGIGWMREHPVESGRDSSLINLHALDAAHQAGCRVFVGIGSACAYPRICPVPFKEDDLWNGRPEPTNEPYAQSKRLMLSLARAYHQQHGFTVLSPMLANLYGPEDHLTPERAHVVAALLQRVVAEPDELVVWGTGTPTREFLYIEDAVDGILAMVERRTSPEPLNIGTGVEVSIRELVETLADVAGYRGAIRFDTTKPDGQPRKCLDVSRATAELGWTAPTSLREGLRRTLDWYREAMGAS